MDYLRQQEDAIYTVKKKLVEVEEHQDLFKSVYVIIWKLVHLANLEIIPNIAGKISLYPTITG